MMGQKPDKVKGKTSKTGTGIVTFGRPPLIYCFPVTRTDYVIMNIPLQRMLSLGPNYCNVTFCFVHSEEERLDFTYPWGSNDVRCTEAEYKTFSR